MIKLSQEEKTREEQTRKSESRESLKRYGMQPRKNKAGITLVALVVTVVVLLILAGVTITYVLGDHGIFKLAGEAKNKTENAIQNEQKEIGDLVDWLEGEVNGSNPISKEMSYVGYYADLEGDGEVDGIIYVDLAKGKTATGNNWGTYEIEAITTGLKEYYISQKSYKGNFYEETKPVIAPIKGSSGKERFYIMDLEDVQLPYSKSSYAYWYRSAYDSSTKTGSMTDYATYTSKNFGRGKENTKKMIARWKKDNTEVTNALEVDYGARNEEDLWGQIDAYVVKGWYVPSKEELSAFGQELGITKENYPNHNLSVSYWSSSQFSAESSYCIEIRDGYMVGCSVSTATRVRMSTTF